MAIRLGLFGQYGHIFKEIQRTYPPCSEKATFLKTLVLLSNSRLRSSYDRLIIWDT